MNKLIYIFVSLILLGCQNPKDKKEASIRNGNISILSNSLYKLNNVKQVKFPENTNEYIAMDSVQKSILFTPYLETDLKAISFGFDAYFVAKQEKIGFLTPIIVDISGTDYSSQWLMLLDSNFVTVTKIELGHQESGPRFVNDTSRTLWPENINYFFHDTIKTVSIIKTGKNEAPSFVIVDSVTYLRKILPKGEIITTELDSSRYIEN
jgi:hypothetical protein